MSTRNGTRRCRDAKSRGSRALLLVSLVCVAFVGARTALSGDAVLQPEQILKRMERRFEQQVAALESYRDVRRYSITHPLLSGGQTYWIVEETFTAPDEKRFEVLERGGSSVVQKRVFARLLEVERETARADMRPQLDLSRENYKFTYIGFDREANAYRFEVAPRREDKYLLKGTIWIDSEEFAVVRIEGSPAQRPSALVGSVRFVHEFSRFGEYWFPVRHRSVTQLRFLGAATLEIEYAAYQWNARNPALVPGPLLPEARGSSVDTTPGFRPGSFKLAEKDSEAVTGGM